jgi:2-dehydro-3-deoxyphosphogluconate aldolase / (4S)-4-hydroxy-2-oxoglutarate aldolase
MTMDKQFAINTLLKENPIIPVASISDVSQVDQILSELSAKGVHCIEITLRTESAFEVLERAIKIKEPQFKVGVGTIVNTDQIARCQALNVDFMVSPGLTAELAQAFDDAGIPFFPGVMTPSEIIAGMNYGLSTFKLFPFNLAGGVKAINTYGNVFPTVKFCPTGGLTEELAHECLKLSNVVAVGGSWLL